MTNPHAVAQLPLFSTPATPVGEEPAAPTRTMGPIAHRDRRRCPCCRRRATHRGYVDGACLVIGCEDFVAGWVTAEKHPAA